MKCASVPSSYMYCTVLTSVWTRANFSPARNVLSTTAPVSSAFIFVRTKAPPLPGLTCWNSTMRQTEPSCSTCMPFRNWFVETVSAIARPVYSGDRGQLFRELREPLAAALRHEEEILDPDAASPGNMPPGLGGEDVPRLEDVGRLRPE